MRQIYMTTAPIALVAALSAGPALAQVNETALQENAGLVTAPPAEGFSIRVNGDVLAGDRGVANVARQADVALADADVQVAFDGLGAVPRLDFNVLEDAEALSAGAPLTLQSALNYPSFVSTAEFRVIDRAALGGPKTVAVIPVSPNGVATTTVPAGDDLAIVHRVYDASGRFDETEAIALADGDRRANAAGVEEGRDITRIRRIPIVGGSVTVSGSEQGAGQRVATLGEVVTSDPSGGFVIQRILRPGPYDINVRTAGVDETRRVTIPAAEWFTTGTVDLTYRVQDVDGARTITSTGRVAAYVDGRTATGIEFTGSIDTGEGELDEIFRSLDEKDPRQTLLRVDPADLYPTFGDDSELVDNTPTSGKIYARVAQGNNFAVWGDFDSRLAGNSLVRNERQLYGLQVHGETAQTTGSGDARVSVDGYAAQPGRLPQRDVFRGTGGSVYFLEKQDIGAGTETVTIQIRDPQTGRVIETRNLSAGRDYEINYIQGIVTLADPLTSTVSATTVVTDPATAAQAQLVVQYEFTPTATDVDGYSFGGRVEAWASDNLRFGVSGLSEETGAADQTLVGVDLRYQLSEGAYAQLDYAESSGAGFGRTLSNDGGLIVDTVAGGTGSGRALSFEAKADFADLGIGMDGAISAYFRDRTEGFSNLDMTVGAATGDETLWGVAVDAELREGLSISAYVDSYENGIGEFDDSVGAEVDYQLRPGLLLTMGLEAVDRNRGADVGQRTDLAARLTYDVSDQVRVYGFAQGTVQVDGLDRNDRYGVGGLFDLAGGWTLEGEVSDGSLGTGARALVRREDGQGNEIYAGYELDPGRDLSGVTLTGRDKGRFVTGGSRRLGSDATVFGENTYDIFGQHRSLTSAYGLTYVASDALRYSGALEVGGVDDGGATDFERYAISVGAEYETTDLLVTSRIETRLEEGQRSGNDVESRTLLFNGSLQYKIDESRRIVGTASFADTDTDESSILDGRYTDVSLGYAYRPVENDRLNLLARYRYLEDQIGQRVDGTDEDGPRQISHVASVDAIYEVNSNWSVGGKIGVRLSETAATEADAFVQNDAWLAVGSVTYHDVREWDALLEVRSLNTVQGETSDVSVLAAAYKHFGNSVKLGVGYNFGKFSDDLTDLVQDDQGVFLNLVAKF